MLHTTCVHLSACPAADGHTGPTQTPPAVPQAIAAAMGPTQLLPARQQQLEPEAGGELSDHEIVASEPPAVGDLVVSDSGSDSDPAPSSQPAPARQQWQQQQQQQQADASPEPGAMQPPLQQQPAAPPLPTVQKRRGLLQISRVGQPSASSSRWQATAAAQVGAAAASQQHRQTAQPAVETASSTGDVPLPSPDADWQAAEQECHLAGQGDMSPASVASAGHSPALPSAGQHDEQGPAASSSSAGPTVDEHIITSRRVGGATSKRQPTEAAARRSVREWSESDSSGEEFPTPTGGRLGFV